MSDANTSGETIPAGWNKLKLHIIANKIDVALWVTRIATVLFTLSYFIPIFGSPINSYYKALMSNAATSALRLHQRIPQALTFSSSYLALLLQEDSCHYLVYSLIYLFVAPVTLVLLPVFLFAVLHSASYSLTLLDNLGQNSWWGARLLISLVEFQSRNILRLISFTEIFLMPFTVLLVFMGKAGIVTPFIYCQFVSLRYSSRRNPYTRNVFKDLRDALERLARRPGAHPLIKKCVYFIINSVSKLAPPVREAQQ